MSENSEHGPSARWLGFRWSEHRRLACSLLAILVSALGVVVRLTDYLSVRSLWTDEAALAVNFRRPLSQLLFTSLSHHQSAPPGFLALEWLSREALGESELSLRLPALLASLLTLAVVWWVTNRIAGEWAGLLGLAVVALNPRMIYYATEIKQYALDALLVAVVYAMMSWAAPQNTIRKPAFPFVALAGTLVILTSNPATLILAGVSVALLTMAATRRDRHAMMIAMALGMVWLGAVMVYVALFVTNTGFGDGRYLTEYWRSRDAFFPWPVVSPSALVEWAHLRLVDISGDPFRFPHWSILAVCTVGGVYAVSRRNVILAWSMILGAAATLVASAMTLYPLSGRLLLFAIPIFAIALATLVAQLWQTHRFGGPVLALAMAGLVLVPWGLEATQQVMAPRTKEEFRDAIEYVQTAWQPEELLYVYHGSKDTFEFYQPHFRFQPAQVILGSRSEEEPRGYLDDIEHLQAGQRLWVVYSHIQKVDGVREDEVIRTLFQERAKLLEHATFPGAATDLFCSADGRALLPRPGT